MTPEERAEKVAADMDKYHSAQLGDGGREFIAEQIREAVAAERERCAKIAERTARQNEARVVGEPLRAKYSKTVAESDRAAAAELRDVAMLIREGAPCE